MLRVMRIDQEFKGRGTVKAEVALTLCVGAVSGSEIVEAEGARKVGVGRQLNDAFSEEPVGYRHRRKN